MASGTARSNGSSGEGITHFAAIRMRVVGIGSLGMTLYSLDDVKSQALIPFTLSATSNREPTRLCNFNEQRASLELVTTELGDYFRINRIIIYTKEIYTSYPGNE